MKKIFAFLMLLLFLVQIVYAANGEQKKEDDDFDANDPDTWRENNIKGQDFSVITSENLANANTELLEAAVTQTQSRQYFAGKIQPPATYKMKNSNEWVLYKKAYPNANIDDGLRTMDGIEFGDGLITTPNGEVNFGNNKADMTYAENGLKVGNIILKNGKATIDSDGYPILETGSSYTFTSPNGKSIDVEILKQRTKHGSCDGIASCIKERPMQRQDVKENKETITELFISPAIGNEIHLSMPDASYDAVAVERDPASLVSVNIKKIDGNLASIDFMQEGAISQRAAGLQTDFYRVDPDNELLFGYGGGSLAVDTTATGEGFEEDSDYQDERFNLNPLVLLTLGKITQVGLHEAGHYAYGEEHELEPSLKALPEGLGAGGSLPHLAAVSYESGAGQKVLAGFDIAGMSTSENIFETINEKTKTGELDSRFMDALAISSALDFPSYALLRSSGGGDKLSDIDNYARHSGADPNIIKALAGLSLILNSRDILYHTKRLFGMNPSSPKEIKATLFGVEVEPEVKVSPDYGMAFMISGSKKW